MYKVFTDYMIAHPSGSEDAAIAAVEDKFDCSRSTVQRHMKPLKGMEAIWHMSGDDLRKRVARLRLAQRLSAFYPVDDVVELHKLGARLRRQIIDDREELERWRASASGVRSKRTTAR